MPKQKILNLSVEITDLKQAISACLNLATQQAGAYACFANAHMCVEASNNPALAGAVNGANLVFADGRPLSIIQKWRGHREAAQVRGKDMMLALCREASTRKLKIGLYGGNSESDLDKLYYQLKARFPALDLVYRYSPPFRDAGVLEESDIIAEIRRTSPDILFVGLGCPKQEIWMANHCQELNNLMLGVGAAFDYIGGSQPEAPRFFQAMGLEWLFRLVNEPRRLWKRYLYTNSRFIWLMARQLSERN